MKYGFRRCSRRLTAAARPSLTRGDPAWSTEAGESYAGLAWSDSRQTPVSRRGEHNFTRHRRQPGSGSHRDGESLSCRRRREDRSSPEAADESIARQSRVKRTKVKSAVVQLGPIVSLPRNGTPGRPASRCSPGRRNNGRGARRRYAVSRGLPARAVKAGSKVRRRPRVANRSAKPVTPAAADVAEILRSAHASAPHPIEGRDAAVTVRRQPVDTFRFAAEGEE